MSDKRMTDSTLQVLHALLADPTRERYGLELSKNSGIAHGTMYGILVRLEDWGWLKNRLDYLPDRATPPRRYYRLTSDGVERARAAVEQAEQRAISGRQRSSPSLGKKAGYAT
jgi:PadR family transcriptional regulator, regulatory protein PadR